ncbi:stalk domain-containing protein [Calidifontibacillus oryziterrae]|uniref:stalk domain-containing protein n=1 Tax=Calidifontibacillus oryziterrae TaxID=1191699 RepID=UPI0002FC8138|nr:stalk domain-containing protein [Calidifontibacillus oryziterrae]
MNHNSYLKGLLSGIVGTTIVISSLASVQAFAPYYKDIKALVTSLTIVVDGKPVTLKSQPLLIDGTTYLPLREIGQSLGKEVNWDGPNNTIFIGQEEKKYRPSIGISQLEPIYGETYLNVGYGGEDYLEPAEDGGKITLYRQNFSTINSIAFLDASSVAYNLYDDKYFLVRGFAGVDDSNPDSEDKGIIKFYGDGKEIATITTGTKRDEPIPFEVDITGVEKLEIKNINALGTASRVALVDIIFEAVQN